MRILKTVEEQPRSTNQPAEMLDLDYKTVRHHLGMLIDNGVVQRDDDDYDTTYLPSSRCRTNWEAVETAVGRMD